MRSVRTNVALLVAVGGMLAAVGLWRTAAFGHGDTFLVYDRAGASCTIIVPQAASVAEWRAAELLQHSLAVAAGRHESAFPIRREGTWRCPSRGVFVGETAPASLVQFPATTRTDRPVGYRVLPGKIVLRSRWPEDVGVAVSWFLEQQTGAHWFMPGRLGEQIPRREFLRVAAGHATALPAFVSRHLDAGGAPEAKDWFARNRLNSLYEHGHSMGRIFLPADLAREPELAPIINGRRYRPAPGDASSWQPNIASPLAAPHAAAVLKRWLAESPEKLSVPLCLNDTVGYDQSADTVRLAGGRGYFRRRPDYAELYFGFVNEVAKAVARDFPERAITTYAYEWTMNPPSFRVEPNVVPFLTADRSQWFDPAHAAEDRALIRRWVAAGPRVVGLYDYLYGAPFLVPRPTLYAVARSIPFAYDAGARAYFAECSPNWGLDGPKLWLAAQLLWDAKQDPAQLLDTYYHDFWQEAAAPMREFFVQCDEQWLTQPLPSYWLKYFKDEHQHLLYPAEVRADLRLILHTAELLAKSPVVRERVQMVSASFAVSEAFADFCTEREALTRLELRPGANAGALLAAAGRCLAAKHRLWQARDELQARFPLALAGRVPAELTRNDPLGGAVELSARLPQTEADRAGWRQLREKFSEVAALAPAFAGPPAVLISGDPALETLRVIAPLNSTILEWGKSPVWRGSGFPFETRSVRTVRTERGTAVRFAGCLEESLVQWLPAQAGALYRASARVRATVSPGNLTFLALYTVDERGKFSDLGTIQRLPAGDWSAGVELRLLLRAPPQTARIGVAMRVQNQVGSDYAEVSQIELRRLTER